LPMYLEVDLHEGEEHKEKIKIKKQKGKR